MPIEDFVGKIIEGDCVVAMKQMPDNLVDAIVTDPPAGISFMGKEWDSFGGKIAKPKKEKNKHPVFKNHSYDWGENPYSAEVLTNFQNFICQVFTEAIRVLKPGGHALVWAIPRTSHHTAMGLERAGFEIRDVITHVFGSGFPKSLNIELAIAKREGARTQGNTFPLKKDYQELTETENSKQFEGLGTALKPASEHWILCRKPISEKTIAENCLKWGTGGLSIDECRVGIEGGGTHCNNRDEKGNCLGHKNAGRSTIGETIHPPIEIISVHNAPKGTFAGGEENRGSDTESYRNHQGRFPANLILECICDEVKEVENKKEPYNYKGRKYQVEGFIKENSPQAPSNYNDTKSGIIHTNSECPCYMLDKQSGKLNKQGLSKSDDKSGWQNQYVGGDKVNSISRQLYLDTGGASRFFYCAKSSRNERNMGCEGLEDKPAGMAMRNDEFTRNHMGNTPASEREPVKNNHPTVKPLKLMEYLVKLVSREKQIVLDPFAGSGSTLIACEKIHRKWIGIEKEPDYIKIAEARIKNYKSQLKLSL